MKETLKKISWIMSTYNYCVRIFINNQHRVTRNVFSYHKKRFYKYSGTFCESRVKDISFLTWLYHVVEKGLAMPNMRLGFGYDKVRLLDKKIREFNFKYGTAPQVSDAISVVLEYKRIHDLADFHLEEDIEQIIQKLSNDFPDIKPLNQKTWIREEFYSEVNSPFNIFSMSRHSIRNFSGPISNEQIINAIELARFAPSACNRQPTRVHIITNKDVLKKCLSLQNGNKGFGHLGDKLLVITGELSTILGGQEFFDLGTNVGIFIMNLCYALHYNKVAHCILNWYAKPKEDKQLRRILNIPNSETIIAFIICGGVPDSFRIASSPRIPTKQIYTIHS